MKVIPLLLFLAACTPEKAPLLDHLCLEQEYQLLLKKSMQNTQQCLDALMVCNGMSLDGGRWDEN
jgi:hypothetical protein